MPLSVGGCEELGMLRCGAPQKPRDEAGAGDKGTQGVALQPVHASLSGSNHAKASSSAPFLA